MGEKNKYWASIESKDNVQSGEINTITIDAFDTSIEAEEIDQINITGDGELIITIK